MKRTVVGCCALLLSALGCAASTPPAAPTPPDQPIVVVSAEDPLAAAFAELVETLRAVETDIRATPAFGDEQERIGGYRHILRAVAKGLDGLTVDLPVNGHDPERIALLGEIAGKVLR